MSTGVVWDASLGSGHERQERIKAQDIAESDQAAAEEEDDGVVPGWINDV